MLTIENATNLVFANEAHTTVTMDVKFAEFSEALPFTATPYDIEAHGVELYNRAIAGDFGAIGEYVPPPIDLRGDATQPQPVVEGAQTL